MSTSGAAAAAGALHNPHGAIPRCFPPRAPCSCEVLPLTHKPLAARSPTVTGSSCATCYLKGLLLAVRAGNLQISGPARHSGPLRGLAHQQLCCGEACIGTPQTSVDEPAACEMPYALACCRHFKQCVFRTRFCNVRVSAHWRKSALTTRAVGAGSQDHR